MLNLSKKSVNELIPQDRLYSLRALQSPGAARSLARWIVGLFLIFLVILFLPWQQNIHGGGVVTALSPANRPQIVPALISGRIESWKVQEGQYVHRGDTIAVLSEVKEKYFDTIRYHADKLELIIDDNLWPLPKYRELLFLR